MKSSKQSNYSATGAMKRVRLTVMGLSGLVFMLVAGGDASAQQRIESDFDLKVACETNPGNVVTLDQ